MRNDTQQTRIEDGCMFILFNQIASTTLNDAQRRYLSSHLSSSRVFEQLKSSQTLFGCEIAQNMLPMWHPIIRPEAANVALPQQLDIAVYDYTVLRNCAFAVKAILAKLGVKVEVNTYSYRELNELAQSQQLNESMIITNINLDDNRHASAFNSLYHNPVLQRCIGEDSKRWLTQSLNTLRSQTPLHQYLDALEPIASALINQYWLTPLFHHRQTLRFHLSLIHI